MDESRGDRLRRVAFQLLTSCNPGARRRLSREKISAAEFFELSRTSLARIGFTTEEIARILKEGSAAGEAEMATAKRNGFSLLFLGEPGYPGALAEIYDPPDVLYLAGRPDLLEGDKLAVVGARHCSVYGRMAAHRLLPAVCRAGLTIVSGMAYGIDSLAHDIALCEGAPTIGVNAGGLQHLYPPGNRGLFCRLRERGLILSEFPLETTPRPYLFPVRNRIIAGLSRAVLVIEAARQSGSLITARLGVENDRDVLAVPGPIDSPLSEGTHYLIQQGAKAVVSPADILDEFGLAMPLKTASPAVDLAPREQRVLDLLGENEVKSVDCFVETLELTTPEVIALLMGMVLKNVLQEDGGGFRRSGSWTEKR
jgi:DNA processing protein